MPQEQPGALSHKRMSPVVSASGSDVQGTSCGLLHAAHRLGCSQPAIIHLNTWSCLAGLCEDGATAWSTAAADGRTPADFAAAVGNQAAAQAAHAHLHASASAEVDFVDEGWPVDLLTGTVLTLDLALAEGMLEPLSERSSSLDSLGSDDLISEVRLWES